MADIIWKALGQPAHYIEPFFGSGAVLLLRPDYDPSSMTETICDKDGFIANVWRAIQYHPEETAYWCDWPVNHADLIARRKVLLANETMLLENLCKDDMWCDCKLAGYWIWAASCWIGSGLTSPNSRPHISSTGSGVHAKGQIPYLAGTGRGVRKLSARNDNLYDWFTALSARLRYVRVVCGDWSRVCGGNWQDNIGDVGIFFDPPYGVSDRDTSIYHHDSIFIAADVCKWALARGDKPSYRIVIAGYDEHVELLEHGWTSQAWKAHGGYSNRGGDNQNCHRETLYFSPHCLRGNDLKQEELNL